LTPSLASASWTSRHAGLGDDGAVRAGLAPYTSVEDVDRLVAGVAALHA